MTPPPDATPSLEHVLGSAAVIDSASEKVRELFTPRGELCALNQQTMAIIK